MFVYVQNLQLSNTVYVKLKCAHAWTTDLLGYVSFSHKIIFFFYGYNCFLFYVPTQH